MKNRKTLQAIAITLMAFWLAIPASHAQYEQAWVAHYDGPPITGIHSNDYVKDMVVRDNYIYVTGYEGLFGSDWATVKYDYAGQEIWVARYEEGIGQPEAMAVDADGNVYVTGYNNNDNAIDVVTFKYSPDGELLWEERYISSGGNNSPNDIAIDASGDIYIAGASLIPGQDDFDLLLLKYDSEGNELWVRTLDNGDEQLDSGYALTIDRDGNAIVAGWTEPAAYLVKYSPTGDLLWDEEHVSYAPWDQWKAVETDADGNIYALGEISIGSQPKSLWTTKYDSNGNILWEQTYMGTHTYDSYAGGLALMPDGGLVITGQSFDVPFHISIVTIRYAPDGTKLWQQLETAGYGNASGDDVAVDADGNIYVTGYGYEYSYWEDIITLGYSPEGDLLWTEIYIGPDYESQSDYPHEIAVDEDLNVFVAAHSWGNYGNDFTTIMYVPDTTVGITETHTAGTQVIVHEPWPNPFNYSTTIAYETQDVVRVNVAIFDANGRLVRTLVDGQQETGYHEILFNGRDDSGRLLTSGIYHARVTLGSSSTIQKLVLMK